MNGGVAEAQVKREIERKRQHVSSGVNEKTTVKKKGMHEMYELMYRICIISVHSKTSKQYLNHVLFLIFWQDLHLFDL